MSASRQRASSSTTPSPPIASTRSSGRAVELGWPASSVVVIDEDLGLSGSGSVARGGFSHLTAEVALGHVGIVLGLEVSRLARNNADWYRLLDLCGMTDTLIGDADGLYDPASFNDRLVLGLKGTMSEAELHVLRARLDGRDPQQGGPRRAPQRPSGRARLGRGRGRDAPAPRRGGAWRDRGRLQPLRRVRLRAGGVAVAAWRGALVPVAADGGATPGTELRWVAPTYNAVHRVLTHPSYAGAYVYGRTRHERVVDADGCCPCPKASRRARRVGRS